MNHASIHEDDFDRHIEEFQDFRKETRASFNKLFRNQNMIFGAWVVITTAISVIEILQHFKP